MRKVIIISLLILYFQEFAWAHPGHGLLESNMFHYLLSGYHLGLVVFTIGLILLVRRKFKPEKNIC